MAHLFAPVNLRDVKLRNRIMISPMCQYSADRSGYVSDWHLAHYGRFAMGGTGLVMIEASAVTPEGRITYGDVGIWDDAHVPGLSRIATFIESQGVVAGIQISHAGRKASRQRPWHGDGPLGLVDSKERGEPAWPIVGPTDIPAGADFAEPAALSEEDIARHISAWANAAARARDAGFRMLEIHGAHGYLIHSFLSPLSNTRTDGYGGGIERRMRLALEITRAVRAQWPEHMPLSFRVSSIDAAHDGWSLDDSVTLARALKTLGVDIIDCSSGGIGGDYSVIPRGPGFQVQFAEHIRRETSIPTIAVGRIVDAEQAETIIRNGKADFVAIGREALRNPNWTLHAAMILDPENGRAQWPDQIRWTLPRPK